jgi:hypothetical protein
LALADLCIESALGEPPGRITKFWIR